MKKLMLNKVPYWYDTKTGLLYTSAKREIEISWSEFNATEMRALNKQIEGRKNGSGGTREGAGRKAVYPERVKARNVGLSDPEHSFLVFRFGSFTQAVRSLLTVGWEFEEN